MDKIIIRGGTPLSGTVRVSGAKNSALPLLFATLLAPGVHHVGNVPRLRDIDTAEKLLKILGADVVRENGSFAVDAGRIQSVEAPYDLVRTMRASVLVLGPLLARCGHARVSLPGGCAIGARPINLHLKGLEALGAEINLDHGYVEARAVHQLETFEAGIMFARAEGILSAPETMHAIRAAIDEALVCKETGEAKTILFNHSGHGHVDMNAYDAYLSGKLQDYEYPDALIRECLADLPKVG